MGDLILVKHATPRIVEDRLPAEWGLSPAGRLQCERLATRLAPYEPRLIVGSEERKAAETSHLLGSHLEVPVATQPGLQENDRTGLPFFEDVADFNAGMQAFFGNPADLVVGRETADQAHSRFVMSIDELPATARKSVVVVSHGAVISLFVARANDLDPYSVWIELGFASFVVLSRPGYSLRDLIHDSAP